MNKEVRICIFSGHTGGHLFPAQAFAERLKKRNPAARITLITSPKAQRMIEPLPPDSFDDVIYLNEFPFPKGISLRTLRFLLEFVRAFFRSHQFLSQKNPHLCVGFGSYVSYPGMKIATWRHIPTLIHEQNTIPGKATQWLATQTDLVAVSFPQTRLRGRIQRTEVTGLPIRKALFVQGTQCRRQFLHPNPDAPLKILVTGGSQGAKKLNQTILDGFFRLSPEERQKIAVTHITGTQDLEAVTERYRKLNMKFETVAFSNQMHALYSQSDIAITRAGANTLFELALFGLPAIVVPFPHAAENHQELNARYFESRGAVAVQNENALTPEWFEAQIQQMFRPEIRQKQSRALKALAPSDAAEQLADLACQLLN